MATVKDIYDIIDEAAPFSAQESWDNSGLLVGSMSDPADRVLLSLDATAQAVEEAKSLGCGLIVTHHPVIFAPLRNLNPDYPAEMMLMNKIACISAHTNLDCAECSVSDMMADVLGFRNTNEPIEPKTDPKSGRLCGYGTICECDGIAPEELAKICREKFGCIAIKYTPGKRAVKRVGLISGAGSEWLGCAIEKGLDALVTAEVKHHLFIEADLAGITLVDAGHYETEVVALPYLKELLEKRLPEVEVIISKNGFAAQGAAN